MRILEREPRETGRDYALRVIKDNIISLDLAPGTPISESELAVKLNLSRTPVREALIELAKVKIITVQPQKKGVVAPIDYDLVDEARFMRSVLERAVIRLACEMATQADLQRLTENVKLQQLYLENYYSGSLMELDNAFHRTIFEIARKPQVFDQIQNISIHFDRVRSMALVAVKNNKIVEDHANLISAIADRDPNRAETLMEKHLSRYKIDAEVIRENYPEYFA